MQRKLTLGFLIGISLLSMVGCDDLTPDPAINRAIGGAVVPTDEEKATIEDRFFYTKDKHGNCYATILSSQGNITIATVPCEKVGL